MVPRTTACARASVASRRLRRFWSSRRIDSNSSRCSSGTGVSLSNGSTAMVRMCGGSPPPAKEYGMKRQPATPEATSASAAITAVRLTTPDRRVMARHLLHAGDVQLEGAPPRLVDVAHRPLRRPREPLDHAPPLDVVHAREPVAD